MKILTALVALVLIFTPPAFAFNCPVVIMQAEDLIKKAEARATPETRGFVDEAKKLLVEARAHHETARGKRDHAEAIRKAKTAAAFAEEAITLQSP